MKRSKSMIMGTVALVASMLFTACKKTEGPQGPAGPQGPPGVVTTSSDGFIKGTLTGTQRNGTAINEAFNFINYWGEAACTLDSTSFSGYDFDMSRGTDILGDNYAGLSINTSSLTNFSSATASMQFTYVKSLGVNKQFKFSGSFSPTITGVTYNASTGQLSGSYSATISGFSNNTGNPATITGTFQTTVTRLYYRVKH